MMINKFKKMATATLAGGALIASMSANAVVVGGIDFGVLGGDPFFSHFETATLAQTFLTGDNQSVKAYGEITTVNGASSYCADGGSCRLYYVAEFNNSFDFTIDGVTGTSSVSFSDAVISVYFANTSLGNLLTNPGGSPTNIANIESQAEWVRFNNNGVVDSSGQLVGTSPLLGGSVFGLYDVDLSETFGLVTVASFLDGNGIADGRGGFADIDVDASFTNNIARLNSADLAAVEAAGRSCFDGSAIEGDWCFGGTADISGNTQIPEPAMLALLGLGLAGMGMGRRRGRSA
jgi:hypothetical protein